MIILFGSNGYIGEEFAKQLKHLNKNVYYWPNTRKTTFQDLEKWYELRGYPYIDAVINAAGYTGKPNVDSCEIEKSLTVHGNIVWPQILTDWCILNDIPLGHVSSGCIYTGKKEDGTGFTEEDSPNFSWNQNNCSFYSGTKSVGEDVVSKWEKNYIWRLRIPFENINNNRNYLSKILNYKKLLNAENSISNKQEFVSACIQLILRNSPFGIYNVTNTGYITTEQIVDKMKKTICKNKDFEFINESLFYTNLTKTPRSNCILDNKKLLSTGIKMSDVNESIDYCLNNWIF
jgi:UDP-glucose 4,6-dehydratase